MLIAGNMRNARVVRFLVIVIAVVLTIFVYASYSTMSTLAPPLHQRVMSPAILQQTPPEAQGFVDMMRPPTDQGRALNVSSGGAKKETRLGGAAGKSSIGIKKHSRHRLPTIDADALADGGGGGGTADAAVQSQSNDAVGTDEQLTEDQQYVQSMDNLVMGNIPNIAAAQSNQQQKPANQQQQQKPTNASTTGDANKAADVAEVLIPTTNLQKFIESADKILKNLTAMAGDKAVGGSSSSTANNNTGKTNGNNNVAVAAQQPMANKNTNNEKAVNTERDGMLSQSTILHIIGAPVSKMKYPKPNNKPPSKPTTKKPAAVSNTAGAPVTANLYESGHLDDEIKIEDICPDKGVKIKMLIMITSAPTHAEARDAIRKSWAALARRRDTGLAFMLGRTTNASTNAMLTKENEEYGDLVRGNFIDSYNNLTLKTISTLEWVDRNCKHAKYVLKTDDDMFINVPRLLAFVNAAKTRRVIYGRSAKNWKPIRNSKSKYYLPESLYPAQVFPTFNTGPAYVLSGDTVHDLYTRALQMVYLKLEDVFITGIVAEKLKIKRVHANEFQNRRVAFNTCNLRRLISTHKIKPSEQAEVYAKFLDRKPKC